MLNARKDQVANQLMRGINRSINRNMKDKAAFKERFYPLVDWLEDNLPRRVNIGLAGVVGKALLWYKNRAKVVEFCTKLKNASFTGPDDPAHACWIWMLRNKGKEKFNTFYKKVLAALRHYMSDAGIGVGKLVAATSDIFEWDHDYKLMISIKKNQYGKVYYCRPAPTKEELIEIINNLPTEVANAKNVCIT